MFFHDKLQAIDGSRRRSKVGRPMAATASAPFSLISGGEQGRRRPIALLDLQCLHGRSSDPTSSERRSAPTDEQQATVAGSSSPKAKMSVSSGRAAAARRRSASRGSVLLPHPDLTGHASG
ncbi:hypothetical protein ACLOJK_037551 [Asimina triloba]